MHIVDHIHYLKRICKFRYFWPPNLAIYSDNLQHFKNFIIIDYPSINDNISIYSQQITYNYRINQEKNERYEVKH